MSRRKNILITGATGGVGYETALRLLGEGYDVQVTGRNAESLAELEAAGAAVYRTDLLEDGAPDRLLEDIRSPDVVIFSAGTGVFALSQDTADAETERMFALNVISPIAITKRLLPGWLARGHGHFIYIGSQAGKVATPKAAVYAATKHALIGYTNALRMEVRSSGIDVTVINPGPIDTAFLDSADDTGNYRQSVGRHLLTPVEVADAAVSAVRKPVREVDLPRIMAVTSKLHAVAPRMTERLGRRFFLKKME
ncbi:putative oxidoreductase YqjQ [Sporosarcina sp. NCCP-2716]|uniref:SDR family NAD(P)-dependent oxidoreductase n=1 Tax=Sporosarcina sp. NCCP-2716 TaxID=2943679 RepID=UPI002041FFA4|nr:SDR family NAD(P)-dependent oxidoreductase [Sporosarcina sp. NCCP-2716]GKV68153.1 putative oxidoreductase YqjQ [Sporosarcina sp. NCCP-2716]